MFAPPRVGRGVDAVIVVPIPPYIRLGLRVALGRILPLFLSPERGRVEVAPGRPHRLVAAAVYEVRAEHTLAVAEEYVVAVPFVHAEVSIEAVSDGVPRHLPTHSRLDARDVGLRRTRDVRERGVAGVQMGEVSDLIGSQGAAATGMLGPAEYTRLEEGAVHDQLTTAFEQLEQAYLAVRPVELIGLFHGGPRHPPALGGQRITGARQGLLFHEQLLARSFPFLGRDDRWRFHCIPPSFMTRRVPRPS